MVSNNGSAGFNNPMDLYNKVSGNKAEFVKAWTDAYGKDDAPAKYQAEKIFNYMAGMDKDGQVGLTKEEYKQGLQDKKALAELKLDKIYSQYVRDEDKDAFAKMDQKDKLAYLESRIPHEAGYKAEAHIQASIVLSAINRLDTEMKHLDDELKAQGVEPKAPKTAAEKAADNLLMTYVAAEDLEKFRSMNKSEKIEYLKSHIPHTPETTDEDLEKEAEVFLDRVEVLKEYYEEEAPQGKQDAGAKSEPS